MVHSRAPDADQTDPRDKITSSIPHTLYPDADPGGMK